MPDSLSPELDPDWTVVAGVIDAEARRTAANGAWRAGLHLDGRLAWAPGLNGDRAGLVRAWLHRSSDPAAVVRYRSDLAIVAGGEHVGLEGVASMERRFDGGALALTVMRDDHLPEETIGPAYWRSRGYAGLASASVPYAIMAPIDRATEWSVRGDVTLTIGSGVTLRAAGVVSDYTDLSIETADFRPDSSAIVAGRAELVGDQSGRVVSMQMAASGMQRPASWSVSYRFQRAIDGDARFLDAWSSVPEHVGRASLTLRPEPVLAIRLGAEARSRTVWPAYAAFDGLTNSDGYTYRSSTPAAFLLNAEIERALFDRRLTVMLAARNLMDVDERTHPLGASLAFRLWAQASLRL